MSLGLPSSPARRPLDRTPAPPDDAALLRVLDHLTTLSQLVTGTARASKAEIDALGHQVQEAVDVLGDSLGYRVEQVVADLDKLGEDLGYRVEQAVADLDELRQRVLRSLTVFDNVRLRAQAELAERPPLTDDEVDRIAAAVTDRLLDHVRVETERDWQ